jgi:alcohol dehydrogenase
VYDFAGGLAALRSLNRGGRLILMGTMTVPLPVSYVEMMFDGWEIMGQFMYPRESYQRLLDLIRSGQLDMNMIRPIVNPLAQLRQAMERATKVGSFECVVIQHKE